MTCHGGNHNEFNACPHYASSYLKDAAVCTCVYIYYLQKMIMLIRLNKELQLSMFSPQHESQSKITLYSSLQKLNGVKCSCE